MTAPTDLPLDDLLGALLEKGLAEELAKAETARRIIDRLREELPGVPRWLVRLVYHWVLVAAVAKVEEQAGSALGKAGRKAAEKLARLPGAKHVLEKLTALSAEARKAKDDKAALAAFIGGDDRDLSQVDFASIGDQAAIRVLEELRDFRGDLAGELHVLQDHLDFLSQQLNRQPPLDAKTAPDVERDRFHYRSRAIPFSGRKADMAFLRGFLDSAAPFAWQLITGGGGAGKSRIALELCLSQGGLWRAGFLPKGHGFEENWNYWRPTFPTLIVQDYAAEVPEGARTMIAALARNAEIYDWPARVLLIERAKDDNWWRRLSDSEGADWRTRMDPVQHAPPRELENLDHATLVRVAQTMNAPDPEAVAARLPEIDPERRPLYLAALADAAKEGETVWAQSREEVLRSLLKRERDRFWPKDLDEEDIALLAWTTMTGKQSIQEFKEGPASALIPIGKTRLNRHRQMTGRRDPGALHPLEPDALGELFVLDEIAAGLVDGLEPPVTKLRDLAWTEDNSLHRHWQMADRCGRDFPLHNGFRHIIAANPATPFGRIGLAVLLMNSTAYTLSDARDTPRQFYDRLARLASNHPEEPVLREQLAMAAVNLIIYYGETGDIAEAHALYEDVIKRALSHPDEPALREPLAKAAFNLINGYGNAGKIADAQALYEDIAKGHNGLFEHGALQEQLAMAAANLVIHFGIVGKIAEARALYEDIAKRAKDHPENPKLREAQARAAARLIADYGNAGDLSAARALNEDIANCAGDHSDEPALRERLAKAGFNLIAGYTKAGDLFKARALYEDIAKSAEKHPEEPVLRELVAKAAANLIPYYVIAGDLAEARALFADIAKCVEENPKEGALQEPLTRAAISFIVHYGNTRNLSEARTHYEDTVNRAEDFPNEPALREQLAKAVTNLIVHYAEAGDIAEARKLYEDMAKRAGDHPEEPALCEPLAKAAFVLITSYGKAGQITEARVLHNKIVECAKDHPEEPTLLEQLAKATVNLIAYYGEAGNIAEARALYEDIAKRAMDHPDEPALRELLAKAGVNLAIYYGEAGNIAETRKLYDEIAELAADHSEEPALRELLSKTEVNLVNYYGVAGNIAEARFLYDVNVSRAREHPEEPTLCEHLADVASLLIVHYGGTGNIPEARVIYENIIEHAGFRAVEPTLRESLNKSTMSLISVYGDAGDVTNARTLYDVLCERLRAVSLIDSEKSAVLFATAILTDLYCSDRETSASVQIDFARQALTFSWLEDALISSLEDEEAANLLQTLRAWAAKEPGSGSPSPRTSS